MTADLHRPDAASQPEAGVQPAGDRSARMLAFALRLFIHGLVVLAAAVVLGVAQTLELWMGAFVVAVALMLFAAVVALAGLLGRLRHRH